MAFWSGTGRGTWGWSDKEVMESTPLTNKITTNIFYFKKIKKKLSYENQVKEEAH